MSRVKKQTEQASSAHLRADPDFVQGLLAVYRELELSDQLRVLLGACVDWGHFDYGFALGLNAERRAFVPLAATFEVTDPRFGALSGIDPETAKSWLAPGLRSFAGFGPLDSVVGEWPGEAPAHTVILPVIGPVGRWAGLIVLCAGALPDPAQMDRLAHLVEMARPAVGNALRVLSMRELVIKDDTASCFNRRHFEEFLPEELARASRFRSPVSLIFLDMDNLKQVNSEHGHTMGSRTLYEVSVRIRSRIRKFDKLFRFGGDEFCIVLPETEWHGALEVAERVRDVIAGKAFLTRELGNKTGVEMSASLGIASFPLHARAQRELIQLADQAMQKIKKSTKNAIGIADIAGGDDGN